MAPIQIMLLMLLVRIPAELHPDGDPGGAATTSPAYPWLIILLFYISHLFLLLIFAQRARSAVRMLDNPSASTTAISSSLDFVMSLVRWGTIAVTALYLFFFHLPEIANHLLAQTVLFRQIPMIRETFYILPALLTWAGCWTINYFVESASRQRSFAYQLARGVPVHEMPSLFHYLSMQIRHNLFLIVPVAAASTIKELADHLNPYIPHASEIAGPLSVLIILVMAPWLITRIWTTVPLRGPLREKLDAVASRHRLRFRNILIWKTHNAVTNAAILGYIPFSRYFLMTDALLETLTDQQIESVFAHEVGHGVHRHIMWYLAAAFGAIGLSIGVTNLCLHFLSVSGALSSASENAAGVTISLLSLALFGLIGFPFISHRFEHQADWFASKHMGLTIREKPAAEPVVAAALAAPGDPLDDARIHEVEKVTLTEYIAGDYPHATPASPEIAPVPPAAPPAAHPPNHPAKSAGTPEHAGTEVFISSLDTIIELAHRSRNRRGWMHPSINNRIKLLRELASDANAEKYFERRMRATRLMIVAVIILGAAMYYITDISFPDKKPAPAAAGAQAGQVETK